MARLKRWKSVVFTGILMTGGGTTAYASFGDAVVGGVVGGVVGSVITNEIYHSGSRRSSSSHRRRSSRRRYTAPAESPVMTDEKRIQQALQSLGYYRGPINGQINSYESRTAIREFNRAYEISDTAYLSPQERDSLIYLGTLLEFDHYLSTPGNDRRSRTRRTQAALKMLGFYSGKIDGSSGPMTRRAIADYRAANGMVPGYRLGYEEEYRLLTTAKQSNDRNIEETMQALKRLGSGGQRRQQYQQPSVPSNAQPVILQPAQSQAPVQPTITQTAPASQPPAPAPVAQPQAPAPAPVSQPVTPPPAQEVQPSAPAQGGDEPVILEPVQ